MTVNGPLKVSETTTSRVSNGIGLFSNFSNRML
jgi:hypothetical protein